MTRLVRNATGVCFAALVLGFAVSSTASPAVAGGWHGGGGGGWHGGWGGGGWHGGWGGWRGGYWRGGGWGWGVPFVGGLAFGALAGSAYPYGSFYGSGYGGCYVQNQPVYDDWGFIVGYRPIQNCY